MNITDFIKQSPPIDAFEHFFGSIIKEIETLDSTKEYAVHNFGNAGSRHSASKHCNATKIVNFVMSKFDDKFTHCDLGGSLGLISKMLFMKKIDSYVIDGSAYGLANELVEIPLERYAVCDLSIDLKGLNLVKYFDVTTCFECLEHIDRESIDAVLENISWMSKYHLCSIHFGGVEKFNHYNISPMEWWVGKFEEYGGIVTEVELNLENFTESGFLWIDFNGESK